MYTESSEVPVEHRQTGVHGDSFDILDHGTENEGIEGSQRTTKHHRGEELTYWQYRLWPPGGPKQNLILGPSTSNFTYGKGDMSHSNTVIGSCVAYHIDGLWVR